ncbi:hypothetical protein OU995_17965 [Roseateles sp. SL47]|uniref:hypothetical protein n=1 Tax=Roseateles sp. SL47 TaxID=2995138 RepID=UPI0022708CBB|nr:hypothetical protein [Roseateles sp. SL47]WAC71460.1 hypothetical protein OU995_17965 [Roseateles sp. SL47]
MSRCFCNVSGFQAFSITPDLALGDLQPFFGNTTLYTVVVQATIPLFAAVQFEAMGLRSYVCYTDQIKEKNGH